MTDVETLKVVGQGSANTSSFDTSVIGGLTTVSNKNTGSVNVTFDKLSKAVSVSLDGQQTSTTTSLNYNGLTATDTVNLALNGTQGASATSNAAVTLTTGTGAAATDVAPVNVAITGTGGRVSLTDAALKTVTVGVSGTTTVQAAGTGNGITKVDASASTGKVTVDLNGTTGTTAIGSTGLTLKGGSADDTFTLSHTQTTGFATTSYALDGGTGNNTLKLVQNNTYETAAHGGTGVAASVASAVAVNIGATGVAINSHTANAAELAFIKNFANIKTLEIAQAGAAAGNAGTADNFYEGAVTLAANAITNISDFKFSASEVNAGAGGVADTVSISQINITGEGNANTFTFGSNVGQAGQTNAATAGVDAVTLGVALDTAANVIGLTLNGGNSGVTITGQSNTATAGSATNASGGNGINFAATNNVIETVNLVSTGTGTDVTTGGATGSGGYYNAIAGGTTLQTGAGSANGSSVKLGNATKMVITGDHSLDLGTVNVGGATGAPYSIDASGLTANFAYTQGDKSNDVITGSAGKNNLTLSGGGVTVDLSKSVAVTDTINMNTYDATGSSATVLTSITGFTNAASGGDKIDLNGTVSIATTGTANYVNGAVTMTATVGGQGLVTMSGVTGSATLADYAAAALTAVGGGANKVAAFQFGSDTYLVEESGGGAGYTAGTDWLVKLVGVTGVAGLSTTASDATHIFIA